MKTIRQAAASLLLPIAVAMAFGTLFTACTSSSNTATKFSAGGCNAQRINNHKSSRVFYR